MPELTVTINGREYQVACDDGQEEHLTKLARYVDTKMGELVGAVGQIGDARLLVMTGLLIVDELSDAYRQLEAFDRESAGNGEDAQQAMTTALQTCAQRIETIAARFERA